jgi:Iron/manganese superoxide dismutases, alpha-hairpin domain
VNETYQIPDLASGYGALKPHTSGRLMELHQSRHHAGYVTGASQALERLAAAGAAEDFATLTMLQKDLAFHLSGPVLHSLFWTNLTRGSGDPGGELADELGATFGRVDVFRKQMSQSAPTVQGPGWALARGSRSPAASWYSRCTTTRATMGRRRSRCSPSTPGSTPTTCNASTPEATLSMPCGRWSTGPTSPRGSLSSGVSMRDDRRRDLDHG